MSTVARRTLQILSGILVLGGCAGDMLRLGNGRDGGSAKSDATEDQLMELNLTPDDVVGKTFYRGRRCEACRNTGYSGRAGLFE